MENFDVPRVFGIKRLSDTFNLSLLNFKITLKPYSVMKTSICNEKINSQQFDLNESNMQEYVFN